MTSLRAMRFGRAGTHLSVSRILAVTLRGYSFLLASPCFWCDTLVSPSFFSAAPCFKILVDLFY